MEVFNVLATMNLVDMMSSPLDKINKTIGTSKDALRDMDKSINSVLTNAMFPLAIAGGAVVTALGACASKAIDFESSMADVAKVVDFTSNTELKGMENAILDMSTKIPMAADGIAAIIASAAQSGVAKENLTEFAEQAAKMGVAFDLTGDQAGKMMADWRAGMNLSLEQTYALADAVNHLSNNMNATAPALGEVIQRVGALGKVTGLAEQEVAALGAAFLSAGASPEIAATALKKFDITLTKATAMSKTQAAAFKSLGFEATDLAKSMQQDAKGTITEVLTAVSKLPEYMHSSMLTEMFGEESIGAIAPLLKNMDNLTNAFDLVSDKSKYAGSMQAEYDARSRTVANAIQLLQNKITKLAIVIGRYLLPPISVVISIFGTLVSAVTKVMETPVGQFFVETAAAISVAAVALSAYILSVKYGGFILNFFAKGLTALKASFLGLSLPIQILIVAVTALYVAYRTNLGGIADRINAFYTKAKLVFQAVAALLKNFKDGSASISGSLAKQIKDAGLENAVTVIFKVIRRAKAIFTGFYEGAKEVFLGIYTVIDSIFGFIFDWVGKLLGYFDIFGAGLEKTKDFLPAKDFQEMGKVLGWLGGGIAALIAAQKAWAAASTLLGNGLKALTGVTKAFGVAMKFVSAHPLVIGLTALIAVIALVIYYFDDIKAVVIDVFTAAWGYISTFISNLLAYWKSLANLLVEPFRAASTIIQSIFTGIWDFIVNIFSGKSLFESGAALIDTFRQGILSAWEGLKSSFTDVLQSLRNMLPFSDAKEGPLSALTLSGNRLLTTLGEGVSQAAPGFIKDVNGVFSQINPSIETPNIDNALNPYINADPVLQAAAENGKNKIKSSSQNAQSGQNTYTITIQNINLPNVQNGGDFMKELEKELMAYGA